MKDDLFKQQKNKKNIELISKYRKVNNKIRKDMKTAKDQWIQMQCKMDDITKEHMKLSKVSQKRQQEALR